MDFTDQPLTSPVRQLSHRGTISAERLQSILRTYVVAFFDPDTSRRRSGDSSHARTSPYA